MCLYLVLIVLLSLWGNFLSSAVVSLIAVGCLVYFFSPPLYDFRINDPFEALAATVFLIVSALITALASAVRR